MHETIKARATVSSASVSKAPIITPPIPPTLNDPVILHPERMYAVLGLLFTLLFLAPIWGFVKHLQSKADKMSMEQQRIQDLEWTNRGLRQDVSKLENEKKKMKEEHDTLMALPGKKMEVLDKMVIELNKDVDKYKPKSRGCLV